MTPIKEGRYSILSLDGGGGKGMYTLGVLREVERLVGKPLNQHFDLFYGTSTGAIIATALAIGISIDDLIQFYQTNLPTIMKTFLAHRRSDALQRCLTEFFGDQGFDSLKVGLGIVGTNRDDNRAIVFKNVKEAAHGMRASFLPGFGVTLAEAVEASCSAIPFFNPKRLQLKNAAIVEVVDGGFVANNPALYALIDARKALELEDSSLRILSIGTGAYPEEFPIYSWPQGLWLIPTLKMISMQFETNSNAVETMFKLLAAGVKTVRVSDTFAEPQLATSLFEHRPKVLDRLLAKGRWSFGQLEKRIEALLNS
jgi:patatin-like phospholipase/acyl hydrolase